MDVVGKSYIKLFDDKKVIENITLRAFPILEDATDEKFTTWYVYTASVCDIIINPDYPYIEVT